MGIVDAWMVVENMQNPRVIIADGGKDVPPNINNVELFEKIKAYVE